MMLTPFAIKTFQTKILATSILTAFLLTACGGGSSGSQNSATNQSAQPTNTAVSQSTGSTPSHSQNQSGTTTTVSEENQSVSFPYSDFDVSESNDGGKTLFTLFEYQFSLRNNQILQQSHLILQQIGAQATEISENKDSLLTKNKLYPYKAQEGMYLISNKPGEIVYSNADSSQDLTQTETYRVIKLANKKVNTGEVYTMLFAGGDTENNLVNAFKASTTTFANDAACYQILSSKSNQAYFSFEQNDNRQQGELVESYEQWVASKKAAGAKVVEDVFANHRVAYYNNDIEFGAGADTQQAIVELNGRIYYADYESDALEDHRANLEGDELKQFNQGICEIYNESAAKTLRTVLASLPKS